MDKLALYGGTPVTTKIFPSWPVWDEREEQNLLRALEAGQWGTLGDQAVAFARRFACYTGVKHAIAVNTGTQALELMLRGADIGRGDEVVVPAYTFVATVSAVAYVGAMPVFADVDPDTGCITAEAVQRCLTERTRAILAVHIGGRPCDMDALSQLAKEKGLLLLEDCAHAHGSEWRGKKAGALGDAAAFSFQGSKAITGGEGGMVVTSRQDIFEHCWSLHHSGRALDVEKTGLGGKVLMGTNGRMAEWEAAVLDAQLDRLDDQCVRREANGRRLAARMRDLPILRPSAEDARITRWNGYIFTFRVAGGYRDVFVKALQAEGIPCSTGYPALHRMGMLTEPYFEKATGRRYAGDVELPEMEKLIAEAAWIPGPVLLADEADFESVPAAVEKVAWGLR